jgi:putative membrane protein
MAPRRHSFSKDSPVTSASQRFSNEDHQRVTEAVVQAEAKTFAEICPVVATISGRYDRAEDIIGLWGALIALGLLWFLWPAIPGEPHGWGEMSPGLQLAIYIVVMIGAFILSAFLGSRLSWLRRLFTPRQQIQDEVLQRAQAVFFDKRIHHTDSASGVLIYISLDEHQAVILADRSVLQAVGQETIDAWRSELTRSLQQTSLTDSLCQVIQQIGSSLAAPLPRQSHDANELSDALIVLD